jgi:DNA-binding winged helix-turn-helix (wHTH) protein/cytochrome c-type biogenesis protein CcmH/NrfG
LRFGAFTLDPERCVLWRGGVEVRLRPQAFDMLRYLAENRGRLVTKDELIQAIWRKSAVSDDSLVRCVRDIRDALDDADHRIIETVRARGYRFAAEVLPVNRDATHSEAAPRFPVGRRVAALAGGAALVLLIGIGAAVYWPRSGPTATASHHAILGQAVLTGPRSANSIREALGHFGKALSIDPNWVPALVGYASVLVIEVGGDWVPPDQRPARLEQAQAAVQRALRLQPSSYRAHQLKGVLLRMRGNPEASVAAFERALELNPAAPWTHAEYARAKIDLGRAVDAIADIETALRLNPSEAAIHVWYCWAGMAALHAGRHEDAVRWLLKALEARPTYPHPVPLLAAAYVETGREAEARSLIAQHLARTRDLTILSVRRDYPAQNPAVATQRERIAQVLQNLGVPEGS